MNELIQKKTRLSKPFWIVWGVEFWERFGYYGTQAILALYFVHRLGYSQKESIYLFGSFSAFVYGFIWVGGYIGDKYLGAKRTLAMGAIILMLSYIAMAFASKAYIYYALAGIVVGNALFKANPSSLISKLYEKGDPLLDSAMTMYYMAINVGSFISMAITPVVASLIGWDYAFLLCGFGLFCGVLNLFIFYPIISHLSTTAGQEKFNINKIINVVIGSLLSIFVIGKLLTHTTISYSIVFLVVTGGFLYFIKIALGLDNLERNRMLIAFTLILEGVVFFVLYFQMPTSLTFFAVHNVNNHFLHMNIPPAEYQSLNPLFIMLVSPLLAVLYRKWKATHVTKFCVGMTFCATAFLVLWIPQFISTTGLISPLWMVITYFLQSTGELLVSGLGLAMVAELCPRAMSGFVMGIWFLTTMVAGPIAAWVGSMTSPSIGEHYSLMVSLHSYSKVFVEIGLITALIAAIMWLCRPMLNRMITSDDDALLPDDTDDGLIEAEGSQV